MSKKCLKKYSRLAKSKKIKIRRAKPVSHQEEKKQSNQEVHAQERKEKSGKLVCKSRTQKRKKRGGSSVIDAPVPPPSIFSTN